MAAKVNGSPRAESDAIPEVDVVISVLNGLPYLRDAVTSALAQTGVRTHVFVVDGGSTDGTIEAVRAWGFDDVTLISGQGHLSTCAARNLGAELGTAPWICFLDADDMWPPTRTIGLIEAIQSPAIQIATGRMLTFTGDHLPDDIDQLTSPAAIPAMCIGSHAIGKELYERVGPFNTDLNVAEFVEWMARARSMGIEEIHIPEIALFRRNHGGNTSRRRQASYRSDVPDIVKAHLARKRAASHNSTH